MIWLALLSPIIIWAFLDMVGFWEARAQDRYLEALEEEYKKSGLWPADDPVDQRVR